MQKADVMCRPPIKSDHQTSPPIQPFERTLDHPAMTTEPLLRFDFMDRSITPTLVAALSAQHQTEQLREGARDPAGYPVLRQLGSLDRALLTCEFRPEVIYWLVAWAH